jgi:hypothetical protein
MRPGIWLSLLIIAFAVAAADDESTPVFRSEVSVGRIDALVLDRSQHPITGLLKEDFILRQDGKTIPIREVGYEDLPVDVLLLLDVSGSMQVHVQKVASAAHQALAVLGDQDRVGIMVFDTRTRVRLPFRQDLNEVERKLDDVVRSEHFNGGTNINGALMDAAAYVEREGRRQTRHAIVIVTDDEAAPCNQPRVLGALDKADAVLMVLLAPVVPPDMRGPYPGGPVGGRRGPPPGTWPGGGGIGGPLGGVIFGPRGTPPTVPGSGAPPIMVGNYGMSCGAPEIARASGGDSMSVNYASAVETTFERIRQRYAVYFHLPESMDSARGMDLDLTDAARRRHPDAALQYRRVGLAQDSGKPGLITRMPAHPPTGRDPDPAAPNSIDASADPSAAAPHRRPGVNDSSGTPVTLAVQPPIEQPADPDSSATKVTSRRRGVSDPGSTPRVTVTPTQ